MPELREQLQSVLGHGYHVRRELGGGGMSRVFVARDVALDRDVVVKVLSPELAATVSVDRFRREILLAATLQHPHIIGVLGAGELDGLPYFTMPYVDGESLRARLQREGRLAVGETVSILRDVARALAYAHERGIVHRDIKPDNILLSGGAAAVTDFGVARAIADAAGVRDRAERADERPRTPSHLHGTITLVGTSLGTPEYMAPEQAAADPSIDGRADIYALGITAYEMLTGTSPFRGRTPQQLLAAQLTEAPAPIGTHRTDVPQALVALVMRCLEKDPASRPQSAAELVSALSDPNVVSGAFISAAVPAVERAAWRRAVRRPSRHLVGGLALASVIAAAAWTTLLRDRSGASTATPATVEAPSSPAGPPAIAQNSVAVLPFVNIGRDSSDGYLAEGITAELSAALGRLAGVQVASPSAVAALERRPATLAELGRVLRVSKLLEGTIQRDGTRLRVTARLVNAEDGFMIWSDVREYAVSDVFTVQEEITSALSEALGTELTAGGAGAPEPAPGAPALARERGTTNAAAYDAYLRGRHRFAKRGDGSIRQSIRDFSEAIARDPRYALAHAGLAEAYAALPAAGGAPRETAIAQALGAAERAVALDSTRAEVWAARGTALRAAWRWTEAARAFRRAVAIDPGRAAARRSLGELLLLDGRVAEATAELQRAAEREPRSPASAMAHARALAIAGEHGAAVSRARAALALDSTRSDSHLALGALQLHAGERSDALRELRTALALDPRSIAALGLLGHTQALIGDRESATATLRTLLARPDAPGHAGAIALVHLGLRDLPEALTWLERAAERRDDLFATAPLAAPTFDPLRGLPRFRELVQRLGLDARLADPR